MRLGAFQSFMSNEAAGLLGSLPPPRPHCFQWAQWVPFHSATGPRILANTGSSSLTLSSSTESVPYQTRSLPKFRATSLEVLFPIAASTRRVHKSASIPFSLRSAPSVSHALDGFLLFSPCKLISSCNHVRDSLFRGFSCHQARAPRRYAVPSCRLAPLVYQWVAPPTPTPGASPSGF